MADDDSLTRMTTNVSPNSTAKTKKVKVKEAPITQPAVSRKTFCEKHPKVCKAGKVVGTGVAVAGIGTLTMAAAGEMAVEKAVDGIGWLGGDSHPDEKPKTPSPVTRKRTTAKKKSSHASRKTATTKKTSKARKSPAKRKTSSKTKTTRKKSTSKQHGFRDPDYWRL